MPLRPGADDRYNRRAVRDPVIARKPLDFAGLEADGADPTNQDKLAMDATGSIALRGFDRARLN